MKNLDSERRFSAAASTCPVPSLISKRPHLPSAISTTASASPNSLREWFSAVQILPHQRGPPVNAAPNDSSIASISASMSLGL